jgi:nucleoside-diphosphate-sugar epimerase
MEIIGGGFIAHHLHSIADRHPDTVAFAAGVSYTRCAVESEYVRELTMLRSTIADCLRTRRRLLYFSTSSAEMYGAPHCHGRESDRPALRSPYGQHKSTVESVLADTCDLDFLVLRMTHLVGANQPSHQLVPALVRQIGEGEVRLFRGAHRDLIAVADAVRIVDILLATAARRDIVNVATGVSVPIEQIVTYLEHRLATVARRRYVVVSGHYPVSVEKLTRLAPEIGGFGFGPDYYRRVIDSYLATPVAGQPDRRPV